MESMVAHRFLKGILPVDLVNRLIIHNAVCFNVEGLFYNLQKFEFSNNPRSAGFDYLE